MKLGESMFVWRKSLNIFFCLCWTSICLRAAQFEPTVLEENVAVADSESHELTFSKPDGAGFADFEPGDLIVLRKKGIIPHDIHVYALSYFNQIGSKLKIMIDPRYRLRMEGLPSMFQPLSAQLCGAEVGERSYEIKVLKARIPLSFFSGSISMIGFGKAVTRQIGILRYIEEHMDQVQPGAFISMVHSVSYKEKNNIFLQEEFRRLESSLRGVFSYKPYLTGPPPGNIRFQKVDPETGVSALEHYLDTWAVRMQNENGILFWSFLVTAPDATYKEESKIEAEFEALLATRRMEFPAKTPYRVFRSTWDVTKLTPSWFHTSAE